MLIKKLKILLARVEQFKINDKVNSGMLRRIARRELIHAQVAIFIAIILQFVVWRVHHGFTLLQFIIIATELMLAFIVGFGISGRTLKKRAVHKSAALFLLGLISAANISSLFMVLSSLVTDDSYLTGLQLLSSAIAIFVTNIIIYSLWYWEIDSPGLTSATLSKYDKDFQFTQQNHPKEFPEWRPEFADYLYISVTNAVNFAAADTKPLTHNAKLLMGSQALISVLTLAILVARSVNILG